MGLQQARSHYIRFFILQLLLVIFFRSAEIILSIIHMGFTKTLALSEFLGCIYDVCLAGCTSFLFFPFYLLFSKFSLKFANAITLTLLLLFSSFHIILLRYFLYQSTPLGAMLFQHPLGETLTTVKTAGVSITTMICLILFVCLGIISVYIFLLRREFSVKQIMMVRRIFVISIPLFLGFHFYIVRQEDHFAINKSLYFYSDSASSLWERKKESHYSEEEAMDFWKLYPHKKFKDSSYPLVHDFAAKDSLSKYFYPFDTLPTIVVVVVEGLSNDFIHPYKGVKLMPFLNEFSTRSLYWDHCFTLGERSFAVIPSLLGALPYGDKGFTIQERYPRHLTLVSILQSRGYQTHYFDGQAAWFHQKEGFFKYNHVDFVFDNSCFAENYQKMYAPGLDIFLGYHDKDLFRQSLKVLDTIPLSPRLDVYFTGTSHSPFVISDTGYYEKLHREKMDELITWKDKDFFKRYKEPLKTLYFVDDAIKEFVEDYSKREEFANTIFVITGDHPMTELPIENALKRYHVPLLIYSPKLRENVLFSSMVSHLDFYETMLSFLSSCGITPPSESTSLGDHLFSSDKIMDKRFAFMEGNRNISDYYANGYYISSDKLYKVEQDLSLTFVRNRKKRKEMQRELLLFKRVNRYVTTQDRVISDAMYLEALQRTLFFSSTQEEIIVNGADGVPLYLPPMIPNSDMRFEVSFSYEGRIRSPLSVISEVKTLQDSILVWENNGSNPWKKTYQSYYIIPRFLISDTLLRYYSTVFLDKKRKVKLKDVKVLIYGI